MLTEGAQKGGTEPWTYLLNDFAIFEDVFERNIKFAHVVFPEPVSVPALDF